MRSCEVVEKTSIHILGKKKKCDTWKDSNNNALYQHGKDNKLKMHRKNTKLS